MPHFSHFARRLRRRAKGEKWGTAPHPSQRAGCPLQSRLASRLTNIERQFEKFGVTHEKKKYFGVRRDLANYPRTPAEGGCPLHSRLQIGQEGHL